MLQLTGRTGMGTAQGGDCTELFSRLNSESTNLPAESQGRGETLEGAGV